MHLKDRPKEFTLVLAGFVLVGAGIRFGSRRDPFWFSQGSVLVLARIRVSLAHLGSPAA
jgi:hypothetical protein